MSLPLLIKAHARKQQLNQDMSHGNLCLVGDGGALVIYLFYAVIHPEHF